MDALHSNHYNFNPYSYSGNNPILFVDKDGLDWYRENGIYMYSPDIHSGKDLKKDQTYMGKSFSIGYGNNKANYQKDGSVLFANETQAYNYIWKVANHHKREVGGFLLNDNNVLVMPEYKNDASTTKLDEYGYSFRGRSLSNSSGTTYNVKAQIHSHQDKNGSPEPSFYIVMMVMEMRGYQCIIKLFQFLSWDTTEFYMKYEESVTKKPFSVFH